ncbi:MAG: DUF6285 domain-containing protein [Myxococcota bacterium]|nr:DUF6285 domain-containing protein [Myxococcota bacterium]
MYDPPTTTELVTAVREFLEEHALPNLEGRNAFHARIAANALDIVARQLELGPDAEVAEQERLGALLGIQGSLDELNRELCRRIRSGDLAIDDGGLVSHLRATTLDKLAVDQPKYSGYRRALEKHR